MGTDCKSAALCFGGSNPPAPTKMKTSPYPGGVFIFWLGGRDENSTPSRRTGKTVLRTVFQCAACESTRPHQHQNEDLATFGKVFIFLKGREENGVACLPQERQNSPASGFYECRPVNYLSHPKPQHRKSITLVGEKGLSSECLFLSDRNGPLK